MLIGNERKTLWRRTRGFTRGGIPTRAAAQHSRAGALRRSRLDETAYCAWIDRRSQRGVPGARDRKGFASQPGWSGLALFAPILISIPLPSPTVPGRANRLRCQIVRIAAWCDENSRCNATTSAPGWSAETVRLHVVKVGAYLREPVRDDVEDRMAEPQSAEDKGRRRRHRSSRPWRSPNRRCCPLRSRLSARSRRVTE